MQLNCKIRNVSRYKHVLIKKFYQVIFWEANQAKLVIYTGIVAGFDIKKISIGGKVDELSALYNDVAIRVHFQMPSYQKSIKIEDVTSKFVSHNEISALKAVWGSDTRLLLAPNEISEWLKL